MKKLFQSVLVFCVVMFLPAFCFSIKLSAQEDAYVAASYFNEITKRGNNVYLRINNEDTLDYVTYFTTRLPIEKYWNRTTLNEADFVLQANALKVEGKHFWGVMYYLTIEDKEKNILWVSEFAEREKGSFRKNVQKTSLKAWKSLEKALKSPYTPPIASPLNSDYEMIQSSCSEDFVCYYNMAIEYYNQGEYKAAIRNFTQALEYNPYYADAYYYRGLARCQIRDINDGYDDLLYNLELSPYSGSSKDGIKFAYDAIARRSERRSANVDRFMLIMGAVSAGVSSAIQIANPQASNAAITTAPAISTSASNSKSASRVTCSFCKGTGKNPGREYAAQFGLGPTYTKTACNICGSYESHYHKTCPSCGGKGYRMHY